MGTWWDTSVAPTLPSSFGSTEVQQSNPRINSTSWISGGLIVAAAIGAAIAGKRMDEVMPRPPQARRPQY